MLDVDPTAVMNPLKHGTTLVCLLRKWAEGPDRKDIYGDHYKQWIADLALGLRNVAGSVGILHSRLERVQADRERLLVVGNIGFEAWREAVDQRRRMLGDVAVAAIFSDITTRELARVERTIRMLDPEDLELLSMLDAPRIRSLPQKDAVIRRYAMLIDGHLGGAALVASGCAQALEPLQLPTGIGPAQQEGHAVITPLGLIVLRFMNPPA